MCIEITQKCCILVTGAQPGTTKKQITSCCIKTTNDLSRFSTIFFQILSNNKTTRCIFTSNNIIFCSIMNTILAITPARKDFFNSSKASILFDSNGYFTRLGGIIILQSEWVLINIFSSTTISVICSIF